MTSAAGRGLRPGLRTCLLLVHAALHWQSSSSTYPVPRADRPFPQIYSERLLTVDGKRARNASTTPPWTVLPIQRATQVISGPNGSAWVLAEGGQTVFHVSNDSAVTTAATARAAAVDRIVGVQGAFVTVSALQVQLMQCAKNGADCAAVVSIKVAVGNITAATGMTNATGDFVIVCGTAGCNGINLSARNVVRLPVSGVAHAVAINTAGQIAVGTELGLFVTSAQEDTRSWRNIPPSSFGGPITSLAFVRIASSSTAAAESLWIGNRQCLNVLHADGRIDRLVGRNGLPMAEINVLAPVNGAVWVGSSTSGAALWQQSGEGEKWRYLQGDRFLTGDQTVSIAADDSAVNILSTQGLARIRWENITLREKARRLQDLVMPRHDRFHVVTPAALRSYGNLSAWTGVDNDNDGLWTGMYVAAQAWRLASTNAGGSDGHGEGAQARAEAWRGFLGLEFLHNVTGVPGLMARSVVRCGTKHGAGDEPLTGWTNSSVCFVGAYSTQQFAALINFGLKFRTVLSCCTLSWSLSRFLLELCTISTAEGDDCFVE